MKNKTKFIAIFAIIVLLFMTSFVLAEDNLEVMPISVDSGNEVINDSNQEGIDNESIDESNTSDNVDEQSQNSENNYVEHDVYLSDSTINIDYFVDGNVYVIGNDVTISSQISGDVFVCARNLTIEETAFISGNVFSIGDSLNFKGIAYDLYCLSKEVSFDNGYIYRDMRVISDKLNIYGTVGRNAFVRASSISFSTENNEKSGLIYGDFNYTSNEELQISDGYISGNINYNPTENSNSIDISSYLLSLGSFIILAIVIWLLSLWLKPKFVNNNASTKNNALWVVICGILGIIVIPVVSILLLFIPIVSHVSLLLLSLFFIVLTISKTVFTVGINDFICKKINVSNNIGKLGVLIITSIVVWLLFLIPYNVGFILSLITMILGFGILINFIIPKKSKELNDKNDNSSINVVDKNTKKEKKNNNKLNKKNSNENKD